MPHGKMRSGSEKKLYKTGRVQDQAEGEIIHQAAAFSSKVYDAISARIDF